MRNSRFSDEQMVAIPREGGQNIGRRGSQEEQSQ